ncbi:MAG: glutamate--cysteine ligase [Gammaproteobacteria bacterium]
MNADILDDLCKNGIDRHLARLQRGIEKESLRVGEDGMLAQTPHPRALGAALTHPCITTDYAEALLELVTPIHTDVDALLGELGDIHHFVYQHLAAENLWVNSMPCIVPQEERIPVARYGSSNIAQMKEAYRRGLRLRYGGLMQTIAGIHFNFSLPAEFWRAFAESDEAGELRRCQSKYYFSLIRNFHRHSWLACYLFGASPAVCKSFPQGRAHLLAEYDAHSFYAPHATSLRLSGLGYNSAAQVGIDIDYNGLDGFVSSLRRAIRAPQPQYEKFGVKVGGAYRQLNANILQIENEFYSVIRPKRVTASGESPSRALLRDGVQYVEVRSIDLNPFAPLGIDAECARFFDMLLLHCLFAGSPDLSRDEWARSGENRRRVVMHGRRAGLELCAEDAPRADNTFQARATALLRAMRPLAELLDQAAGRAEYAHVLDLQLDKVRDPEATPSARIIREMTAQGESFYEFGLRMSAQHARMFKQKPMDARKLAARRAEAAQSHARRREIEAGDEMGFDAFLEEYFRRQNAE